MVEPGAVLVLRATYRLQFHKGIGFDHAAALAPISPGWVSARLRLALSEEAARQQHRASSPSDPWPRHVLSHCHPPLERSRGRLFKPVLTEVDSILLLFSVELFDLTSGICAHR